MVTITFKAEFTFHTLALNKDLPWVAEYFFLGKKDAQLNLFTNCARPCKFLGPTHTTVTFWLFRGD